MIQLPENGQALREVLQGGCQVGRVLGGNVSKVVQGHRDSEAVPGRAADGQRLLEARTSEIRFAQSVVQAAEGVEGISSRRTDWRGLRLRQRRFKVSAPFPRVTAQDPETPERGGETQAWRRPSRVLAAPGERLAKVVVLGLQAVGPLLLPC